MNMKVILLAMAFGLGGQAVPAAAQSLSCNDISPFPAAFQLDERARTLIAAPPASEDEGSEDSAPKADDADPCSTIILAPFDLLDGPDAAPSMV